MSSKQVAMEEEEARKGFKTFDKDSNGLISGDELENVFDVLGLKPEERQAVMSEFDKDGDCHIDLEEFKDIMMKQGSSSNSNNKDLIRDAFDLYYVDNNGYISASELQKMLNRLGHNFSIEECREMITKFDNDGDGLINFQEFEKMMNPSFNL